MHVHRGLRGRPGPRVTRRGFANVSTRTVFALARIRVLPRLLATLHPRPRSPGAGIAVQTVVAIDAVLGLGFAYDPVTAFLLLARVIVTVVVGVYIVVNPARAGYFLRGGRQSLKPVRHLLFPLFGVNHRPLFGALTPTPSMAALQPPLPERVRIWQLDRTRRTALSGLGTATSSWSCPSTPCTARWAWPPPTGGALGPGAGRARREHGHA
ncbi:hypothetical protein [Streptomyces sp. NPDC007905]|uniref:hypothetical protein n=1 Tax=Streptomyces sp. NPDC007905 TaxID=3364788 RepID=UPI0036F0025F